MAEGNWLYGPSDHRLDVCAWSQSGVLGGRVVVAASRWWREIDGWKARWLHHSVQCSAACSSEAWCGVGDCLLWLVRVALRSSSPAACIHLHLATPVLRGCNLSFAMSSWLPESHRLQLAVTALASGCIAASAVIGLQNAKRWYSIHDLKGSIPDLASKHDVEKV